MAHLDPERLILVAFGEQQLTAEEAEHLEHCATCAGDHSATEQTIAVARETQPLRDLSEPSEELWQRISDEAFSPPPAATPQLPAPRRHRDLRRSVAMAICAALAGIAATLGAQWLTQPPEQIVAEATLLSKNDAARSASGTATIIETDDGLQMKVDVSGMPPTDGYYTVWLFDGADAMIPVGTLGSAPLNLPDSIRDVSAFPVIDVSLQEIGQQTHGITMLQGEIGG